MIALKDEVSNGFGTIRGVLEACDSKASRAMLKGMDRREQCRKRGLHIGYAGVNQVEVVRGVGIRSSVSVYRCGDCGKVYYASRAPQQERTSSR